MFDSEPSRRVRVTCNLIIEYSSSRVPCQGWPGGRDCARFASLAQYLYYHFGHSWRTTGTGSFKFKLNHYFRMLNAVYHRASLSESGTIPLDMVISLVCDLSSNNFVAQSTTFLQSLGAAHANRNDNDPTYVSTCNNPQITGAMAFTMYGGTTQLCSQNRPNDNFAKYVSQLELLAVQWRCGGGGDSELFHACQ